MAAFTGTGKSVNWGINRSRLQVMEIVIGSAMNIADTLTVNMPDGIDGDMRPIGIQCIRPGTGTGVDTVIAAPSVTSIQNAASAASSGNPQGQMVFTATAAQSVGDKLLVTLFAP